MMEIISVIAVVIGVTVLYFLITSDAAILKEIKKEQRELGLRIDELQNEIKYIRLDAADVRKVTSSLYESHDRLEKSATTMYQNQKLQEKQIARLRVKSFPMKMQVELVEGKQEPKRPVRWTKKNRP